MLPHGPLVGIALAVLSALAWASHYLFVRVGMEESRIGDVVLIAVLSQAVVVVPAAFFVHPDHGLTVQTIALFAAAGLASGLFGRVFQYTSTRRIGASKTSPIVASAGLVSAVLAILLLDESATGSHLLGIVLIVAGVSVTSWETAVHAAGESHREAGIAITYPVIAALFYGIEPLFVKFGLEQGTPPLVGLAVMSVSAGVAFFGYRRMRGPLALRQAFTDRGAFWSVLAGVVGAVAYVAYVAALSTAPVVIVLPIFQTTPVLVAVLSLAFMPRNLERVTWRLVAAAIVVVVGATLVSLAG